MAENQLPQDEAASTPPSILRRILSLPAIVSLVLAALFLVFIITRFDVDLSATWDRVTGSNPWLLALAVVVHYTTFIFRGVRWRLLLENTSAPGATVPGFRDVRSRPDAPHTPGGGSTRSTTASPPVRPRR